MEPISLPDCNLEALDSLSSDSIDEILETWNGFCSSTESLFNRNNGDVTVGSEFVSQVQFLCDHSLQSLVQDHFFHSLEVTFEKKGASVFWQHFDAYIDGTMLISEENRLEEVLCKALEEISLEKQYQERSLLMLIHGLHSRRDSMLVNKQNSDAEKVYLLSKYQLMMSSVLMSSLPRQFPAILHQYFKGRLEELSTLMDEGCQNDEDHDKENMDLDERFKSFTGGGAMDIDEHCHLKKYSENSLLVKNIGKVVQELRSLGFTSMTEDAYASAIFLLLKDKVQDLAGDDYRSSVLDSIKLWIRVAFLQLNFSCSDSIFGANFNW